MKCIELTWVIIDTQGGSVLCYRLQNLNSCISFGRCLYSSINRALADKVKMRKQKTCYLAHLQHSWASAKSHQECACSFELKKSYLCLYRIQLQKKSNTLDTEVMSSLLILDYLRDLSVYICVGIICVCYMVDKSAYYLHVTNLNPKREE